MAATGLREGDEAEPPSKPGAGSEVRPSPTPKETQPISLSDYWQRYSRATPTDTAAQDGASEATQPTPPSGADARASPSDAAANASPSDAVARAAVGKRRPRSSAEMEPLDLAFLEREDAREPSEPLTSLLTGLGELEDAIPSLPASRPPKDELPASRPLKDELPASRLPKDELPASRPPRGEGPDRGVPGVPVLTGGAAAHAGASAPAPTPVKGPGDTSAADEMDAKKTGQWSSLVLADGLSTSRWDLSNKTIQRRDELGLDARDVIGKRYRILEPLATGGMARIYRVQHLDLGKEFALKIIHTDLSSDPQTRKIFIREARVSSLLEHPNIVQVTDFGVDERHGAYLVLEFLRGETLNDRLDRERPIRVGSALDIALQVAEGLHYMHQQNIIHCDIKPENIFLHQPVTEGRRRLQVKLIDFGLSRREALGATLASTEVGGTPQFMAPEQIQGLAPRPSMDIYALGILLYEMVTGTLPFDGAIEQVLRAQLHEPPQPPSDRLGEPLGEYVDQLIMRALDKDPRKRQSSMGQVIFELRALGEMLGLRSSRAARKPRERTGQQPGAVLLEQEALVFEGCPCPLFRVDTESRILVANLAFARFIGVSGPREVVGRPLDGTRLGQFYPSLRADLLAATLSRSPMQRVLSLGSVGGRLRAVMIWLVPEADAAAGQTTFVGTIVPVTSGDEVEAG